MEDQVETSAPYYRRFSNPNRFNVLLFDQRGAGRSTPFACIEHNTTQDLVADIGKPRRMMGVDQWIVFGGRLGCNLGLGLCNGSPRQSPWRGIERGLSWPSV